MAMPVGIGTFTKHFCILRICPVLIVQAVGGIKMLHPGQINHCCNLSCKSTSPCWFHKNVVNSPMHILLVAATEAEITGTVSYLEQAWTASGTGVYARKEHQVEILISGVGTMATTYSLTRALLAKRFDLALQA